MIIKLKNNRIKFYLGIILILLLSYITIDKQQLGIAKEEAIQFFMAKNPGFSHRTNLVDSGKGIFNIGSEKGFSEYKKLIFPSVIKAIPKIIQYKIIGKDFERIDIDIKFIDYQKILDDRNKAIKRGGLNNPSFVNAKIKFKENIYNAELRLKGDLQGHWLSKNRMSLRVNLKGERTILGFKKFTIQKPGERQHPYDYVFHSLVRKAGNLAAVHNFAHIYVNGDDWGIMDIEEHMSKEFLEKQKRKESAIVRFSNEKLWLYSNPYPLYRISDPSLYVHLYADKKYLKDNYYRKVYSYISTQHKNYNSNLYDIDSLTKSYILSLAWSNFHTLANSNSRYYFNPYTLKLESITTDQAGYKKLNGIKNILHKHSLPPQYLSIMTTQSYLSNLSNNIFNANTALSNTQKYLDEVGSFFPVDKEKNGEVVINNMNKIISNKNEYFSNTLNYGTKNGKKKSFFLNSLGWQSIEVDKSQIILPTYEQILEFEDHLYIRHYTNGKLEIYNLLPDNVTVKDILFNDKSFLKDEFIIPSYLSSDLPIVVNTQYSGIQDNKITIKSEYRGFIRKTKNKISLTSNILKNPLLLDNSKNLNFLIKLKDENYEFKRGNWIIEDPIVVNGDLYIPSGVNIKFSNNAYLIVKGALIAIGKKNNPIIFESLVDSWKGIYVLNAKKKSHIKNVIVKNVTALESGILKLTGGITFYRSNVIFENVSIEDVYAEDAINIVESMFSMNLVNINKASSDGLDSDFSQGVVTQSKFSNIQGDALDFSGSIIDIDNVNIKHVKDKAVSGGEESIIKIKNSTFNNVGVGIVSKDGSNVFVNNTTILNYKLHAIMSYVKKDYYSMPSINVTECNFDQNNPYGRQKGTKMIVDNIVIKESDINVEKLYKSGIMKK